jgi:hypothetical protein
MIRLKRQNILRILLSLLLIAFGITQLILTFYGYQHNISIRLHNVYPYQASPIYRFNWGSFFDVSHGWSTGITSLISGFLIYQRNLFSWIFITTSCTFILFSSIYTYCLYQVNVWQWTDIIFLHTELLMPYKLLQLTISVFGLIVLFNKRIWSETPMYSFKYYLAFGFAAILVVLVYFL